MRDPEVGQTRVPVLIEQHVGGLDVAMHDARRVDRDQRDEQLARHASGVRTRSDAVGQARGQSCAGDAFA